MVRGNNLLNEINQKTCNKFNFLKLKQVFFAVAKNLCQITLIYPSNKEISDCEKEEISKIIKDYLALENATYVIKINKSFIEKDLIEKEIVAFLKDNNPVIYNSFDKESIKIDVNINTNVVDIIFDLQESIYNLFDKFEVERKLLAHLDANFCASFQIKLLKHDDKLIEEQVLEKRLEALKAQSDLDVLLKQTKDKYFVSDKKVLIGNEIEFNPRYISSVDRAVDNCVLAGSINFLTERSFTSKFKKKNKDGTEEDVVKPYFSFNIKDSSGSINAVIFPSKANYHKMHLLKNSDIILVKGKVSKYNEKFEIMVKDLSLCAIPNRNEVKHSVIQSDLVDYKYVRPVKYSSFKQSNLFDTARNLSKEIREQSFVVYDFETTGIDPNKDEIIEIGALKIVNGEFSEVFSTLVKPKHPIPKEASKVNRITDDMVKNSYSIEQVICDFFIFCKNCQMVGYNSIAFDYLFLNKASRNVGIHFDNTQIDAFLLARDKVKGLHNYKLGTVSKALDVNSIDAHRALNDVIATAEVFMKLY